MYDYQSQTSLPPIRARQQRQSGVQVQQLYESSPVLAISHHPSNTHYTSHKLQHGESATVLNGNSTTTNNTNGTTNGYHTHHHHNNNNTTHVPTHQQIPEQSVRNKSPSADSMLSMNSLSQQRRPNALDPDAAMKTYMSKLTAYERHEIFSYPQIYFVGQNARKRQGVGGGPNNGKKRSSQLNLIDLWKCYSNLR